MLLPLPFSPAIRVPIEPGSWSKGVCRVFWIAPSGRRCCIDSRPLSRLAAIRMATRIVQTGDEAEVLAWVHNTCRPPDYRVHRIRNLELAPPAIVDVIGEKPAPVEPREQTALF